MELEGYVIYEPISYGDSPPLWRAEDSRGNDYALQILGGALDEVTARRLHQLQMIDSPHVLGVKEVRKLPDGRFVVRYEFIAGQDLEILRAARRLTVPQVNLVAQGAAQGLAALHAAGLAHGDISAGNLMVSEHGRVVLVDILGCGSEAKATVEFSAPEVLASSSPRGATCDTPSSLRAAQQADVFALAQVLLTLGMSPAQLGMALSTRPQDRPSAAQLADAFAHLPTEGIGLLSAPELTTARARAAGRDVKTQITAPTRRRVERLVAKRKPGVMFPTSRHRVTRPKAQRQRQFLHRSIIVLAAACLGLFALAVPNLMGQSSSQATAVRSNLAAGSSSQSGAVRNFLPASQPATASDAVRNPRDAAAVLSQLLRRRDAALISENDKALANCSVQNSVIRRRDRELLTALRSSGATLKGLKTTVEKVEIIQQTDSELRLGVTLTQEAYTQVDRLGNVHQVAPIHSVNQVITLRKSPWRMTAATTVEN